MLSFPLFGQYWLGQIDLLICVGLVLAVYSPKPLLRGLGICLMMIKPQIVVLVVIFLIFRENKQSLWKVILPPAMMVLLSLVVFGVTWPVAWYQHASSEIPNHVWKLASGIFWPWGVIALPLVFLFPKKREGTLVALLLSSVVMPFFSVYSYLVFLIFESSIWTVLISYLWIVLIPIMGNSAMQYAWILPIFLLAMKFKERFFPPESSINLAG